ncbi:MAG: hypothetical protein EKK63_01680 [Acinetobacter sp.]|uniref:hypothetical protein n=1 Tax=Acinetobacter sp. TaxID=472 RepID=UPI000FB8B8C7|nr:hypothetical protein [Acinetobacter sp.]RUP42315.1 MAG: hypothetical protein EKK63_01680 [Acinetobacter sp.]
MENQQPVKLNQLLFWIGVLCATAVILVLSYNFMKVEHSMSEKLQEQENRYQKAADSIALLTLQVQQYEKESLFYTRLQDSLGAEVKKTKAKQNETSKHFEKVISSVDTFRSNDILRFFSNVSTAGYR